MNDGGVFPPPYFLLVKTISLKTKEHYYEVMKNPIGKFYVDKVFVNSRTGQKTISLPEKKLKGFTPKRIRVEYW